MKLVSFETCLGLSRVLGGALASVLTGALPCSAADIDSVLVRQQWPWSTDVKVEYRLSNVTAPVNINVECFNDGKALPVENIDGAIIGRTYGLSKADEGIGFFYIDPVKAFGKTQVSLANFTVKLTLSATDELDTQPIYRIIDLQTKEVKDLSRADFYNDRGRVYGGWETNFAAIGYSPSKGEEYPYTTSLEDVFIWTGVTNNIEYKTTKLVMRRIPAKNKTFLMGSNPDDVTINLSDNFQIEVTLTNDYWMGVFEVTARQHELLNAGKVSTSLSEEDMCVAYGGDKRHVSYEALRGLPSEWTGWPENVYAVSDGAIKNIRERYGDMMFDLPTEAQWEYACRAGTYTQDYSGVPYSTADEAKADIALLARCNNAGSRGQVGVLRPNAFGLYDMLGNVGEAVRDLCDPSKFVQVGDSQYITPMAGNQVEPMGWNDLAAIIAAGVNCKMMYRGGNHERNYAWNRSSDRRQWYAIDSTWSSRFGYRLWLYAE